MNRPSKKHHFVPQAQLRYFATRPDQKSVYVYDKQADRSFPSAIRDAGSENDFNTVSFEAGKWNFEDLFNGVDGQSARLLAKIIAQRSIGWLLPKERIALSDLIVTQMLPTSFGRTTPRDLAEQMRQMVRDIGYDPDDDPSMAMPTDSALRLGAVKNFLERDGHRQSLLRLVPALFEPSEGKRFIISDHPVAVTNAFPYGDHGLASHGIIVVLPVTPDLAIALTCTTIISRYEVAVDDQIDSIRMARILSYRDGFRSGTPIVIQPAEVDGYNQRQVSKSARFIYSATNDFEFARQLLSIHPELRDVRTHVTLGEIGRGPPRNPNMPSGLHIVVFGQNDSCMMPISEIDPSGEGLTAKTSSVDLLALVAEDRQAIRIELFDDGHLRRGMGEAKVERFGNVADGWFRIVHRDQALRAFAEHLESERRV